MRVRPVSFMHCIIGSQCCGTFLTPCFPHYVNILNFLHGYIYRPLKAELERERAYGLVRPEQGWSLLCRHCIDCSVSHTLSCLVQEERNVTSFTSLFVAVSLQLYVSVKSFFCLLCDGYELELENNNIMILK